MHEKQRVNIFWFRRDLRLNDNHGLYKALTSGLPVLPIFIFDVNILNQLQKPIDRRVQFIHHQIKNIYQSLHSFGSSMLTFYGDPAQVFKDIIAAYDVQNVFCNRDYETYAIERDDSVKRFLLENSISFHSYKDQVIFDQADVMKDDGKPYTIFTPYSKKWKSYLLMHPLKRYPSEDNFQSFLKSVEFPLVSLEQMGFISTNFSYPNGLSDNKLMSTYQQNRDFPAISGTSRLGIHLRFGTISVRELAHQASLHSETFLNELIWRDFYHMIIFHFPHVCNGISFKCEYDAIEWRNDIEEFEKWKEGYTGYPIVDAGMRELKETGFMHNRVRMITASFLTKHLMIDWRWGERWFAQQLLDFDFAANNGGWQWAAGSGCDAAPYFRIFNPYLQTAKFDKDAKYIRQWVPEFDSLSYPQPIVQHEYARKRCLHIYGSALKK